MAASGAHVDAEGESVSSNNKDKKSKADWYDQEEYSLRKRLPRRLPKRKNDVYVSRKTDFKQQFSRCQRLLDSGWDEIYIHGLGAAINRAINLSLQLQSQSMGSLDTLVHTSTVELIDDMEPQKDDVEPDSRTRNNSAVHIKLFRVGQYRLSDKQDENAKS